MKPTPEMACRELVEWVTHYLEGALPPEERDRFEAHHRRCAGCAAHVSQVRLTVEALGRMQSPEGGGRSAEQGRILDLFRTHGVHRRGPRERDIPLGIGDERVALGDHIAYFWESEREFEDTAGFLAAGASLGEACVLIGQDAANERVLAGVERLGANVHALLREGQLQVASVHASADALLLELDGRLRDVVDRGMPAVRILGNLNWGRGTPGWPSDREILRLEAQVTSAVERLPAIVVCTYEVTHLPGPLLLQGGLECHPLTLRRGCLRHNEHHVPAERFLAELPGERG